MGMDPTTPFLRCQRGSGVLLDLNLRGESSRVKADLDWAISGAEQYTGLETPAARAGKAAREKAKKAKKAK